MKTPLTSLGTALRVLAIACVFFVAFDACFIALRPFDYVAQHYSLRGTILPYYQRYVDQGPEFFGNLPVDYVVAAHEIARPKAADEFRVLVLGDSGIAGLSNLNDNETVSEYMNRTRLRVDGKQIVTYNFAAVHILLERDLLLINAAVRYKPDMILWFITCPGVGLHITGIQDMTRSVTNVNATGLTTIRQKTGLSFPNSSDAWWKYSILFKRVQIKEWLQLQLDLLPAATARARPIDLKTLSLKKGASDFCGDQEKVQGDLLLAGSKLSGVPVLYVNEPIMVAPDYVPGAADYYDAMLSRTSYDSYRVGFADFCRKNQLKCLDIWNLVPPEEYTNSPLHRTARGNQLIAGRVLGEIDSLINVTF